MDQEKAHKKCLISVGSIFLLGIEHDAGSTSPCGDWGTNWIHPFTIRNSDPKLLLLLFQMIKISGSKRATAFPLVQVLDPFGGPILFQASFSLCAIYAKTKAARSAMMK